MTAENEPTQDNEKTEPEAVKETEQMPSKGPGQILKEAREAKGLSQREVADQLRLRKQIIELLEVDDYSTFSTPTFIKGYLRAYAKLLDLDDTELFQAYKAKGFQEVQSSQMQSFSRRKKHQENDNRLMLITYVVIIVVIALVIWWWQEPDLGFNEKANGSQESSEVAPTDADGEADSVGGIEISNQPTEPQIRPDEEDAVLESDVEAEDTNVAVESVQEPTAEAQELNSESTGDTLAGPEPVTEETDNDSSLESAEEATPEAQSAEADAEPMEAAQVAAEQSEQPEASSPSLVLDFNEECWVKIDDATGETQAVGVKAAGYRMPVPGEAPFSVTLCKPEAVNVSFNGNAVDMSQFRTGRVARFTVPTE
ncbi:MULTISPECIES: RodZ domain-containing protein [Idiomarina]|jgi:cytoskeleton protein RodZ|uniref:RodZ domain-containing protein n=1 Tax=Idiomarina TaxID=135575 RepID=UPI000C5A2AF0|nr:MULTISPECIES: RodZ domain-containing protein [Idiomarina]MAB21384.1 transcriptional regulator [Idiomarina sp.]MBH93993.1 transcriptional regulator [Idiomarina sp.]|tara:strand:+ start:425 stop:1531 length:1107 start_codon:yes stop_codon:yes gene_type:complete